MKEVYTPIFGIVNYQHNNNTLLDAFITARADVNYRD